MPAAGRRIKVSLEAYVAGVRAGDRATLARAITLIESSKGADVALAEELLQQLLPWRHLQLLCGQWHRLLLLMGATASGCYRRHRCGLFPLIIRV